MLDTAYRKAQAPLLLFTRLNVEFNFESLKGLASPYLGKWGVQDEKTYLTDLTPVSSRVCEFILKS